MRWRRIFGYARVSSVEQSRGSSLQDQQDAIRRHATAIGGGVTRMFVEAESAVHEKIERREQIQALLADVRSGDLVLVDKLDRWSRDPEFTYRSVREILAAGASFFAVGDQCDPSTPEGDTMLGFRVLFAREEHKRIRQRMVGTRQLLRARGYYCEGLPPFGYRRRGGKGPEHNVLEIDEAAAAKVREMFALCLLGHPLSQIATMVGETQRRVHVALRNRAVLGEVRGRDGTVYEGRHEPLVDAATFVEVQQALRARQHGERAPREDARTATWWLRTIAHCLLCDAKMSSAWAADRDYYKCSARCTTRYVRVSVVETQAAPLVLARLVELREMLGREPVTVKPTRVAASVPDRRDALARKRARYAEMYADGTIDRPALNAALAKLDETRTKLDALAATPVPVAPEERRRILLRVDEIAKAWERAQPDVRRRLVTWLARSVGVAAGEAPRFDWLSEADLLRRGGGKRDGT